MISTALYNEIAHTHLFEMEQAAFYNHAKMFLSHYRSLTQQDKAKAGLKNNFILTASGGACQAASSDDGLHDSTGTSDSQELYISFIRFSGPMMRNGGACAYGSIELREMIMRAADDPRCIAQVFIVDTPGGSSATKNDLQEAMEYAHSKGQETVMQVDGMVMSAGMAWAAMCKKRYARSPYNQFGCMGTYASFYTNQNGDVNAITREQFHVVYADGSPDKNKALRLAAEGDDSAILQMVNRENDRYKEIIRKGIPNVTDEQLLGGEWEAHEVIGSLCDGIRSLDEIVDEIWQAKGLVQEPDNNPDDSDDPDTPGNPSSPVSPDDPEQPFEKSQNSINNQFSTTMGKKYEKIQSALGLETLESGHDNSLWLHEEMADALTAVIENAEHTQTALEAKQEDVKNLTEKIGQLTAQVEQLQKSLNEAAANQETFNQQYTEAMNSLEEVKAERDELLNKVEGFETRIAEQDAVIEEKDKTIAELSEAPSSPSQPAVVATKQTAEVKPLLASDFKNRTEAKEAHRNFMQQLRDRM